MSQFQVDVGLLDSQGYSANQDDLLESQKANLERAIGAGLDYYGRSIRTEPFGHLDRSAHLRFSGLPAYWLFESDVDSDERATEDRPGSSHRFQSQIEN